jgi:hypothetical protein
MSGTRYTAKQLDLMMTEIVANFSGKTFDQDDLRALLPPKKAPKKEQKKEPKKSSLPPKPLNAFNIFSNEVRLADPKAKVRALWKEAKEGNTDKYDELAKADKDRYQRDIEPWIKSATVIQSVCRGWKTRATL